MEQTKGELSDSSHSPDRLLVKRVSLVPQLDANDLTSHFKASNTYKSLTSSQKKKNPRGAAGFSPCVLGLRNGA